MSSLTSLNQKKLKDQTQTIRVRNLKHPGRNIMLEKNELLPLKGDNRWRLIICLRGRVWVTQERDLGDYELCSGDIFLINFPGTVVIQALESSCIELTPSLKGETYTGDVGYNMLK